jgi:hypothetical protein
LTQTRGPVNGCALDVLDLSVEAFGAGVGDLGLEEDQHGGPPGLDDGRGLVGCEVVADQVDLEPRGHGFVDGAQELLELDRAVSAVQRGDHPAVGDVERGEQA